MKLWKRQDDGKEGLPAAEGLDEEVARLHLEQLGAKLTKLTPSRRSTSA